MAGKKGKSGRKAKFEDVKITALLDQAWPMEERHAVIQAMSKAAKKGNVQAATLLLSYSYGKPTEKHEHGGEGGGPLQIFVNHVSKPPAN